MDRVPRQFFLDEWGRTSLELNKALDYLYTLKSLPVYANNAAAITGGLAIGDLYRTGADPDFICVVR